MVIYNYSFMYISMCTNATNVMMVLGPLRIWYFDTFDLSCPYFNLSCLSSWTIFDLWHEHFGPYFDLLTLVIYLFHLSTCPYIQLRSLIFDLWHQWKHIFNILFMLLDCVVYLNDNSVDSSELGKNLSITLLHWLCECKAITDYVALMWFHHEIMLGSAHGLKRGDAIARF